MTGLSGDQAKALLGAVERIHAAPLSGRFFPELCAALDAVVPGAVISLGGCNMRTGDAFSIAARSPEKGVEEWRNRLCELLPTHPVFPHVQANPNTVIAITDCVTQRQFRNTPFFQDIMKPVGVSFEMVVGLEIPHHVAGMAVARDRNFTPSDREIVGILAPHLALAYQHAQNLAALEKVRRVPLPSVEAMMALGFTAREADVLNWIMEGKRDSEIASILGISPRSVHKHVQHILTKLNVETRTAAAMEALRRSHLRSR